MFAVSSAFETAVAMIKPAIASTTPLSPTNQMKKAPILVAADCVYRLVKTSVFIKRRMNEPTNNRVFSRGQQRLAAAQGNELFLHAFISALKIRAVSRPSRSLGTKQIMKVLTGLSWKSIIPNWLVPEAACQKLVRPNTAPHTAPAEGPSTIAPMATGMMLSVISMTPILMYPMFVKPKMISSATSTESWVRRNIRPFWVDFADDFDIIYSSFV